jgi:hypothetical protein
MARRTYCPSQNALHAKVAWIESGESDLRNRPGLSGILAHFPFRDEQDLDSAGYLTRRKTG